MNYTKVIVNKKLQVTFKLKEEIKLRKSNNTMPVLLLSANRGKTKNVEWQQKVAEQKKLL